MMNDCSAHGIGITVERALNAGEEFLMNLHMGGPCVLLYTVRNCQRTEGGYRVGAEFTAFIVAPGGSNRDGVVDALMRSVT